MNTTSPQNPENSNNDPLPWGSGPYSTKRFGTSLTNCDSEPVQSPGCIQSHGALITCRLADLCILQVSENSAEFFGLGPTELLGQPLTKLLAPEHLQTVQRMLGGEGLEANPLYAFTVDESSPAPALDVCAHTMAGVLFLEFEATGRSAGHASHSHHDFFTLVRAAVRRMQSSTGLLPFCQQVATEVRNITGLDRVMVYRFHRDNHGEVVAESMKDGLDPWLGLHYPETDIPQPARDIYKRIWIRPVPHAAGPLVEMVPLANPDTGQPLTMTHCALRGTSVMYTEYLANMDVAASLTMPILIEGALWGLIACHHTTPTVFPHQLRAACEVLAQVASLQLKSTDHIEQLAYQLKVETVHQQLLSKAAKEGDFLALSDRQPSLLDAMDAEGAAVYHMDRWWCAGKTPTEAQLSALAEWVNLRPEFDSLTRPVFETDRLPSLYPNGAAIARVASGLIAVQFSRAREDLIMWFRPAAVQTVKWAGNPNGKALVPGPHGMRITPRRSFELFLETVRDRSLPWTSMEVDSALRLRLLMMELHVAELKRAERKLAEKTQALAELDHRKDEFLAMLSHELRNPLAPLFNAVQLLRRRKDQDPVQQQAHAIIERQAGQLNHLIDELLEISRISTGRVQLRREQVTLGSIVSRALETTQPLIAQVRHVLAVTVPSQPIWLYADAVRLEQVVVNLLTNAAKYTDRSGQISVDVQQEGDFAVLRIADNGIGIDPELLPHIFELFTQAGRSLDRSQGGLGVGLCLVQRLVELHGGSVSARSTVGQGSEFVVRLPTIPPASLQKSAMVAGTPSTTYPAAHSANALRILVVDDNVDAAQSMMALLQMSDHEVKLAFDGPSALVAAGAWRPDVVLLDIGLPGINGYEVARRLRQDAELGQTVLIALTGYGQESDRQNSRAAGFDYHLTKPTDYAEIEKLIKLAASRGRGQTSIAVR